MKATVRQAGEVAIVDLNGKITIGEGDVILRELCQRAARCRPQEVLLNLEKVKYMDSAGIGELVACYKRPRRMRERSSS